MRVGTVADQSELARLACVAQPRMKQIMNLLPLAPDLQEAILSSPGVPIGRDPFTEGDRRHVVVKASWSTHRASSQAARLPIEGSQVLTGR